MKTKRRNAFSRLWHQLVRGSAPTHDRYLALGITNCNFSTGWDRLLQKQQRFGA